MAADSGKAIRVAKLHAAEERSDYADASPSERVAVMWQLAVDAWTLMGQAERAHAPLQRDYVRIRRGPT